MLVLDCLVMFALMHCASLCLRWTAFTFWSLVMISSCVFTAICVSLALSEELGQLFQSFIIMFLHLLWLQPFHESSRAAFSLFTGFPRDQVLPDQCPINEFTFNVSATEEMEYPVMVALGYITGSKGWLLLWHASLGGWKNLVWQWSDVVVIGNSTASGGDEVVSGAASN